MTKEDIKRIVDDERAEQLTTQLCRHWEVATKRLEGLVEEMETGIDTCVEAELYAAMKRMQSAVMALMELNKIPCVYLFSEYLDRVNKAVSNVILQKSLAALFERLSNSKPTPQQDSFFDLVSRVMTQSSAMPQEKVETVLLKALPMNQILLFCAQYMKPEDLIMMASMVQELNIEPGNPEDVSNEVKSMRKTMDHLTVTMAESQPTILLWLLLLMLLPGIFINYMLQSHSSGKSKAQLFNKVLMRVRESNGWGNYWNDRRQTLQVVNDGASWNDVMATERSKEYEELSRVPGGLFAKWTADKDTFADAFLAAQLSDDVIRHFIFHLAALSEIAREQNPLAKYGQEQLVKNDWQKVVDAVKTAALKLDNLVTDAWLPFYEPMWNELIENEAIFDRLKITRKSPHNNLFTARFFCHLVGEMKKRAVFGAHSDNDLAEKLSERKYVGTFRKNIQEGMGDETEEINHIFNTIFQKYNHLAHPKR